MSYYVEGQRPMPRERPILFSGEMVRAILDGRKTQTRRVVKADGEITFASPRQGAGAYMRIDGEHVSCPYGKPGDLLWVRETWTDVNIGGGPGIAYRADEDVRDLMDHLPDCRCPDGSFDYDDPRVAKLNFTAWHADQFGDEPGSREKWHPSIHMPRWASRILLEVIDVRVERVRDISAADAWAEGVRPDGVAEHPGDGTRDNRDPAAAVLDDFEALWDSINAKRGYGWGANPWVWVVEFEEVRIDHAAAGRAKEKA